MTSAAGAGGRQRAGRKLVAVDDDPAGIGDDAVAAGPEIDRAEAAEPGRHRRRAARRPARSSGLRTKRSAGTTVELAVDGRHRDVAAGQRRDIGDRRRESTSASARRHVALAGGHGAEADARPPDVEHAACRDRWRSRQGRTRRGPGRRTSLTTVAALPAPPVPPVAAGPPPSLPSRRRPRTWRRARGAPGGRKRSSRDPLRLRGRGEARDPARPPSSTVEAMKDRPSAVERGERGEGQRGGHRVAVLRCRHWAASRRASPVRPTKTWLPFEVTSSQLPSGLSAAESKRQVPSLSRGRQATRRASIRSSTDEAVLAGAVDQHVERGLRPPSTAGRPRDLDLVSRRPARRPRGRRARPRRAGGAPRSRISAPAVSALSAPGKRPPVATLAA